MAFHRLEVPLSPHEIKQAAAQQTALDIHAAISSKSRPSSKSHSVSGRISSMFKIGRSQGSTPSSQSEPTPRHANKIFGPLPNSGVPPRDIHPQKVTPASLTVSDHSSKKVFGPLPNSQAGGLGHGATCPWEHPLFEQDRGGWCCDDCGVMSSGGCRFGCLQCNYDLCLPCTLRQQASRQKNSKPRSRFGFLGLSRPRNTKLPFNKYPPVAAASVDVDGDGRADYVYIGADRNRDGIPDAVQAPPQAVSLLDLDNDGRPDMVYVGADRNGDGIPDDLQVTPRNLYGYHTWT